MKWELAELSLGDTIGVANPKQVQEVLEVLLKRFPADKLAMHFHDTRGTALANILVSLEMGITIFDSSLGGLGGCPYAPGASGNVATDDLLYMLHGMGIHTGADQQKLFMHPISFRRRLADLYLVKVFKPPAPSWVESLEIRCEKGEIMSKTILVNKMENGIVMITLNRPEALMLYQYRC